MDSSTRPTVFVSYSHRDEVWKDRLVQQLQVLELEGDLEIWDDRRIDAGDDWQTAIETAMAQAAVAVLLISADFLTSKFIRGTEIPKLLRRRESEGLRVIPVIVRPCPWQTVSWLAKIQCRPKDGKELASFTTKAKAEKHLSALALEIRDLLAGPPPLTPPPQSGRGEAGLVHQDESREAPRKTSTRNPRPPRRALATDHSSPAKRERGINTRSFDKLRAGGGTRPRFVRESLGGNSPQPSPRDQGELDALAGGIGEKNRPRVFLPVGTVLQGDLVVGRLLEKPAGGFGITYLGWDRSHKRKVAIKEYLPRDLAGRAAGDHRVRIHSVEDEGAFRYGCEKFIEEARILAHLDHRNIVKVHRFFEENGTAYLVMDYHDGVSLDQYLEGGKRLPETEAVDLLLPILDALSHIHTKGHVHLDVKPSKIYLKGNKTPVLLDFGAAHTALGERTRNLSMLLSPGCTPIEQYSLHGQVGPWTDVYGAAATLYRMLTGKVPLAAHSRYEEDKLEPPDKLAPGLSHQLTKAVLEGLAIKGQDRPQSAEAFAEMLRPMASGWAQKKLR